jgi:hypothetical protein
VHTSLLTGHSLLCWEGEAIVKISTKTVSATVLIALRIMSQYHVGRITEEGGDAERYDGKRSFGS